MNLKLEKKRNDVRRTYLDESWLLNNKRNVINLGSGGIKHEVAKLITCLKLREEGKEFYTEARMKGGGIADIFVLDDTEIIEILSSETNEMLSEKIKKYPSIFITKLNADEVLNEI